MKVTVIPAPPPPKVVTIELSEEEASALLRSLPPSVGLFNIITEDLRFRLREAGIRT